MSEMKTESKKRANPFSPLNMKEKVEKDFSCLIDFPPMGVYETLFAFKDATGLYMGSEGTHPWYETSYTLVLKPLSELQLPTHTTNLIKKGARLPAHYPASKWS